MEVPGTVSTILEWVWVLVLISGGAYAAMGHHLQGAWRLLGLAGWAVVSIPIAFSLEGLAGALTAPDKDALAILEHAGVLAFVMTALWFSRRRRLRTPTPTPQTFPWGGYLFLAGALVTWHAGLVWLQEMYLLADIPYEQGTTEWWQYRAAVFAVMFFGSQLSTSWAIRSLGKSLSLDWTHPDGTDARRRQYLLVAAPLVVCLVPSVLVGPLLAGVLLRLAFLWLGWKFTAAPPLSQMATLRGAGMGLKAGRRAA